MVGFQCLKGIALYGIPVLELRSVSVTCRVGSHSVTCRPTQVDHLYWTHFDHSQRGRCYTVAFIPQNLEPKSGATLPSFGLSFPLIS